MGGGSIYRKKKEPKQEPSGLGKDVRGLKKDHREREAPLVTGDLSDSGGARGGGQNASARTLVLELLGAEPLESTGIIKKRDRTESSVSVRREVGLSSCRRK